MPIVDPTAIADQTLPVLAVSPGIFDAVLAHVVTGRVFDRDDGGQCTAGREPIAALRATT